MGLFFEKGEILQLTVGAYQPEKAAIPFGSAKITVPEEGFTYMPGQPVKMITLGGDATECADPSEVVTSPATHNVGLPLHLHRRTDITAIFIFLRFLPRN